MRIILNIREVASRGQQTELHATLDEPVFTTSIALGDSHLTTDQPEAGGSTSPDL